MFLVEDRRYGVTNLVFTYEDPRKEGYAGDVVDGVRLDYDMEAVHRWRDGEDRPEACVGRDPADPKHYKVFKYRKDLESERYQFLPGTPSVHGSWGRYLELFYTPPDPVRMDEEDWYKYLDNLDEGSRARRKHAQVPDAPSTTNRDDVAAWVAKRHLIADSSVREVLYLPQGAPPEEIRLLELNDRLAGDESKVEAIDFGLDVEGARYRLLVADITRDQFEQIEQDTSKLPQGWSLQGRKHWGRRGA
jgi:hypothetical protein